MTPLWDMLDAAPAPLVYAAVGCVLVAFAILERTVQR